MSVSRGCVLGNKILDKDLYIKHYNHIFSLFKFLSLVMVLRMITTESILLLAITVWDHGRNWSQGLFLDLVTLS